MKKKIINEQAKNTIISGLYEGEKIVLFKSGAVLVANVGVFISKETVHSVRVMNTQEGNVVAGAIIAGIWGALAMSEEGYALVEISWNSGEKSLAKMSKEDTDKLIFAAYESADAQYTDEEKRALIEISTLSRKEAWALLDTNSKTCIKLLLILGVLLIMSVIPSTVLLFVTDHAWFVLGYFLSIIGIVLVVVFLQINSEDSLKNLLFKKRKKE